MYSLYESIKIFAPETWFFEPRSPFCGYVCTIQYAPREWGGPFDPLQYIFRNRTDTAGKAYSISQTYRNQLPGAALTDVSVGAGAFGKHLKYEVHTTFTVNVLWLI